MNVLGVPWTIAKSQKGVIIIDSLTIATSTRRVGLDKRSFFFLWIERTVKYTLTLSHCRCTGQLIVIPSEFRPPRQSQKLYFGPTKSYLVILLYSKSALKRSNCTQRLLLPFPLFIDYKKASMIRFYFEKRFIAHGYFTIWFLYEDELKGLHIPEEPAWWLDSDFGVVFDSLVFRVVEHTVALFSFPCLVFELNEVHLYSKIYYISQKYNQGHFSIVRIDKTIYYILFNNEQKNTW